MRARSFRWLLVLLIMSEATLAQAKCFGTVADLRANKIHTRWQETTENDGKPLTISIADGGAGLVYSARKAGQVWLTGNVSVCHVGGGTQITLKNTKGTHNVPLIARMALPSTQSASIVNNHIRLSGGGWGGTFVGH